MASAATAPVAHSREQDGPHPLVARDLNAYFGTHHAVEGVSLSFPLNSVTALIGPSGCGKSTFIRCLNRMHELIPGGRVTGDVLLHGQDVYGKDADAVAVRRAVGMVFQRPNPFPTMSIADNVAAGLRLGRGQRRKNPTEAIEKALHRAGLWDEVKDRLHDSALGLSGGQQQRLVIARTIAVEPEVLLLDEPCSALDPISTARIEELVD